MADQVGGACAGEADETIPSDYSDQSPMLHAGEMGLVAMIP
jgi:hypothetical protein